MKEKMYIHSTDSSCEKTKQEKQKHFSILLLKKQKKTLKKTKTARWKKTTPQPSEMKKKRNFDFDIMCHQFLHAFCLFCHVLPHTTTTIYYSENKNKKTLVNYYVFLSFFFSSFRNFSYVLGKIAGKCWQWKETKKFSLS